MIYFEPIGVQSCDLALGADIAELSMAVTLNVVLDIPLISTVVHVEPGDRVHNMSGNLTR